ncbi:immunomodulatory autotransporter protein ImaA [Helicobacter bizzozeronii]|uniref:vacuolating cytotoxin domain-containing protein n=1 Tax=Helicobacter bizzozeronii TaxID=56877 RepID=UPI00244D9173|nr:vacuolating cytotoxin domain-containing protein [Helicobacter bizzozeronii]GMB92684.1 immunomodulatory autotransporter protein ImaA [Helicobacter bizzozeronii]
MKKCHSFKLRVIQALAKRAKANPSEGVGVATEAPQTTTTPKRLSTSQVLSKWLSNGAFVLGGGLATISPLQAWIAPVNWIQGQHDLNTTNILGYMSSNSESVQSKWIWGSGIWNKFYYHSGGGIQGYYCTNWDCNGSVTLVGNQSGTYYLHQLQYDGGSLNLQINGGTLSIGDSGNPPNVNITSYYGTHFTDNWNAQSIQIANKLSVNQTTLNLHGNRGTTANNAIIGGSSSATINITDKTSETFTNTTFQVEPGSNNTQINFDSPNITFNHVTYSNGVMSTISNNQSLTFENNSQFTLSNDSPFTSLGGNVDLQGVTFNITKALNQANAGTYPTYDVIKTSGTINYNGYTKNLWDLIHYQGITGTLYTGNGLNNPNSGLGTYYVRYNTNNPQTGEEYIFKETFSNKKVSMQFVGSIQSIWNGVYQIYNNQNYDVGNGIGYIDPGTNPNNPAQTWSSFGGTFGASLDKGNGGTLIIGNKTENPNKMGVIRFGGTGGNSGLTGYITGNFKAQNIYLTSHIQSGNAWGTGGGTSITYTATDKITMDGLSYQNFKAGTQNTRAYFSANNGNIDVQDSSFSDQSWGSFSFSAKNTSLSNSQFSGNSAGIDITGSQSLNITNTSFSNENANGNIALKGGAIDLTNTTFKEGSSGGSFNLSGQTINISGASANPDSDSSYTSAIIGNQSNININATGALNISNTLFNDPLQNANNPQTMTLSGSSITLDNTKFEGYSQYQFNTQNLTLEGTTTLKSNNLFPGGGSNVPASPFSAVNGLITLGKEATFNILNSLTAGQTYTLLKGKINYNDNKYAHALWEMINYQGMHGQLLSQSGDVYTVGFDVGGLILKMQETLNSNSFTLKLITNVVNIWGGIVYPLNGNNGYPNINIGDGIAYINPLQGGQSTSCSEANTLCTWGSVIHHSFDANITGTTGILVIGNNHPAVATGGTIWLGKGKDAWLNPAGGVTGTFNAPNIYMTNNFKVGNFAYGQASYLTFKATNNITTDGLSYRQVATAIPLPGGKTLGKPSSAYFMANSINLDNSHFSDSSRGLFSFTGYKSISFNQSDVQGDKTAVTLDSPNMTLNGGGFFLGNTSTLTIENSRGGGGTLTGTGVTFNLNGSGSGSGSTMNINVATTLGGDSALFLNNTSTATFNQQADFAGNSALNLDNNSSITFNGNTTLSGNALLSLMNTGGQKGNQSKVAFNGTATLNGNANISLSQGSVATFKGLATFGGQSSLNMVGTGQNGQPQTTATFGGGVAFGGQSSLNLSDGASASIQGQSNFEGNTTNLSNSTLSLQDVTFNAGNLVMENSAFNASGAVISDGTTNMNLYGNNSLSMGSFDVNGLLNLNGAMSPNTTPLINVTKNFTLAPKAKLNLANIDIFTNLENKKSKTFDILKAGSIVGLGEADGYQNIGLYGLPIQDASYNQANDSWSFVNPLNGNQIITESVQNNNLKITISANPNPSPTLANLYNIAPELFYYKQSRQNPTGTSYDYNDDRVGTFFLDSNVKGIFTAPVTAKNPNPTPQVPTTYNTSGHPLDPLYIYNSPINKQVLTNLFEIASSLFPALEQLLKSFNINDLSDPNKLLQALSNSNISLTDQQKQQLLDFIDSLSSNINQTFKNGTLVVGATQVGQVNNTSQVWFGGNGYAGICAQDSLCKTFGNTYLGQLLTSTAGALGYINANFNAKDIYITGTLGSGNATQTGGSASVSFNSATNLVLNQANVTAQQTDQVFNLLGTGGIDKILGQPGLGQALGNIIYQTASNNGLIPQGLQDLLPKSLSSKTLGSIFNAGDLGPILQLPGFATAIKDIMTSKTVGSLLSSNGLISHLDSAQQAKIYNMLQQEIDKAGLGAKLGTGIIGGSKGIQDIANSIFGNETLWNLMALLSPATGMTLNQALAMGDTPQGVASMQKFLDTTTFGQVFKMVFENANLVNEGVKWLGPQLLGTILNMAIQDALNPPKALTNMAQNVGMKILSDILGPDTLKALQDNTMVSNVINGIIKDGGLGGVWQKGLGSILPPDLQEALKKAGVGALLAPKGLSTLWEKGYFSFLANDSVFVNNSTFSNATGGDLSFVAGKSLYFVGDNSIDFTNYQGTLNLFSNDVSNINLTTLNATNGLTINAQFNNVAVQKGTIALNQYESLGVSANNFSYLGTINADGAVNLSSVTNQTALATLNLTQNATLQANNLTITKALTSTSTSVLNVAQNLNLQSGATLDLNITKLPPNTQATQAPSADGLQIGGGFNSAGTISLSVDSSLTPSQPLIQANGLINFNLNAQTPLSFSVQAPQGATTPISGTYTLMQSNSWIHYNPTTFNPNNWQDYLNLYTSLKINGTNFQLNTQGTGLTYNGQVVNISDRGLLVTYQNGNNQSVSASIAYNKIQVGVNQPLNIEVPTIKQYISQIQGEASVRAIESAGGPDVMGWFNKLLIETKNTPLFAPYYLEQHSLQDMVKMAKDIANSIDLIASPTLKANASDLLQISSHTKQMSRLAKLSNFSAEPAVSFHDFLQSLKGKKFASAVPNAMDIITAYSQRDRLKNNFWVTGVGGASFVAGGTGTLYGINIGYDRFIKGVIVGGYAAYGYSGFYGNISNASSNNVNLGFYSRAFLKGRHELTGSVNETWGYNKATINALNPILSVVNQKYDYNTWTTNIGANYGYDFFFKEKRVILKPQIGLTYYYIGLSRLQGSMANPLYNQFKANADPANKSVLTLNLALESRHYFKKNSYYYVIAGIGRDLFVNSMGDKQVRFIGNDTLSYRNGGLYNTFMSLTTGGEVRLWRSFYINAGIGARFGLDYKDINVTGNVGMRYAF